LKKVIISVTNDLTTDQRVHKVAGSLICAGFSVLLVGAVKRKTIRLDKRKYQFFRFNMFFKKSFLFYFEYNVRLFFFLLINKSDILLSNDLDTLCANYFVSRLKKIKLVYDSHELFSELPELLGRKFVKNIWLIMENFFLKRIDSSYTVSASIANYYKEKYGIDMSVISNFPNAVSLKSHYDNSNFVKKIIYQGAVNRDRGIELMIDSMKYIDAQLYIVGGGDILDEIINYVAELKLNDKVFVLGRIPFPDLFQITKEAHLGLSFERDTCLAYRYSLPNKIFDYINAEIPILVSDLPEFKNVIQTHNVGMILKSRHVRDVAEQINLMLSQPKSNWYNALLNAKKQYCWENQEKKLLTFFS
tara:strand:- start:34 stop:1113 length:1080 start_codon:yes stop_codon:yes gene_type:complete